MQASGEIQDRTSANILSTDAQRSELHGEQRRFFIECNRHLRAVWPRRDSLDEDLPEYLDSR